MSESNSNPAKEAARRAHAKLYACLDENKSFRLEAGAGAGKTFSLVKALERLIEKRAIALLRHGKHIACITYTNVASDEIKSRTDSHPAVFAATIHAFCWSLIKDFQKPLREEVPILPKWAERLSEVGGIGSRRIEYELGHRRARKNEDYISLGHDDVLALTVKLTGNPKFRHVLTSRYPILLIDEYQDSDKDFASALKAQFLDRAENILIGCFGDHWQKIYGDGCGKLEHEKLVPIDMNANFRSAKAIVDVLNRMRPELPQEVVDPSAPGSVAVYHTNNWVGTRLTGPHTKGDLPPEVAHAHLEELKSKLAGEGWDFSPEKTKILMLTHAILSKEQGYAEIAETFQGRNDQFAKKEDPHIAFLVDVVEPVCKAYKEKKFGEMFAALGRSTPAIHSHADKISWAKDMDALLQLRTSGTVGAVIDLLKEKKRPRLPENVERREQVLIDIDRGAEVEESEGERAERLRKLRAVPYAEIVALDRFIDGYTPFSTKHGVKGAEFENVLVVIGRGWNKYDFNKMLEYAATAVPSDRQSFFEDNRNLFYVVCSRPKKRLALLAPKPYPVMEWRPFRNGLAKRPSIPSIRERVKRTWKFACA